MTRNTLAVLAALTSLALAAPAAADPFTYADERCKAAVQHGVICSAVTEETPYREFVGYRIPFEEFVRVNNLPTDVTIDSVAPAFTMFVTSVQF